MANYVFAMCELDSDVITSLQTKLHRTIITPLTDTKFLKIMGNIDESTELSEKTCRKLLRRASRLANKADIILYPLESDLVFNYFMLGYIIRNIRTEKVLFSYDKDYTIHQSPILRIRLNTPIELKTEEGSADDIIHYLRKDMNILIEGTNPQITIHAEIPIDFVLVGYLYGDKNYSDSIHVKSDFLITGIVETLLKDKLVL